MSSWEEYKAKRTGNTQKVQRVEKNSMSSSSWEEYKRKREEDEEERKKRLQEQKERREKSNQETESKSNSEKLAEFNKNISSSPTEQTKKRIEYERSSSKEKSKLKEEQKKELKKTLPKANEKSEPLMSASSFGEVKEIENKSNNGFYKQSNAFNDGYQVGDVTKTILGTAGDIGINFLQGMHSLGSGISKGIAGATAQVADWIGADERADRIRKNITSEDPISNALRKANDKVGPNSMLGEKSENVVQGVGNVGGMIALRSIGVPWQLTSGLSSVGSGLSEAYSEGATDKEAWLSAGISAGAEIGSEYAFGGIKLPGTGKTTEKLIDGLTDKIKSKTLKQLAKFGINSVGEGAEEVFSGVGNAIGKQLTYMNDKELNELYSSEQALDDFVIGTITSTLAGGIQQLPNNLSKNNVADQSTGRQQDIVNELQTAQNIEGRKQQQEQLQQNSAEESNKIIQNETLPVVNEKYRNKNIFNQETLNRQQTILNQNQTAQNQNISETEQNSLNLPVRYLNYVESARKYNIDTNNETVQSIARVTNERGIKTTYNADVFSNNNQNAIWRINTDENGNTTREVILNPNADTNKTLQSVIVHELIHDMEGTKQYNDLKNLILNYDKTKTGFEEARKFLEETYSKIYDKNSTEFNELIDNEAVADILGNKLGDQEFINNLTTQNRTLGQKIYDWVVDKLNKINEKIGYKSEKLYWTDVKNKFENAFKQEYISSDNNIKNKFSIQQDKNGKQYVRVDTDQNIFDGIPEKDYNKIAKMYMQDYLMGETSLSNNDKAIIDGKSARKYTNPGKRQYYFNEKMKLTPELKNVLEIAQKDSISAPTKDTSKYQNWEYYKFNFELDGKNFEGTINIGIDKNGNKHFYEINKIHFTGISSVSTNSQHKADSINNSIAPTKKNVNTTDKYSIQESENNTKLSEEAKKQLHRYAHMDTEQLNKAFSDVIVNKENMLDEVNKIRKEYKEFQNTEGFKSALEDFSHNDNVSQQVKDIMNKAQKYADKIRYYNNAYETYKAQQEAINSLLMGNETDARSTQQIVDEAEKHFGVTNNFKETAYIDINGNQIDFSGKHEGGPSGERTLDHRQINEIDIDMDSFISIGNIRILPEGGGINLKIEPNTKQYNKLQQYIDSVDGEIYIDIDKSNNTYDSAEYKKGTPTNKILNDIKYYFKNGKFPQKSELAQFRYSLSKNKTWQSYLDRNYKNTGKGQTIKDVKLPQKQSINKTNNAQEGKNIYSIQEKTLNPTEISQLNREDANTTPKLSTQKYAKGNKQSSFFQNITNKSRFLNEDFRSAMKNEENIEYYKTVTNKETLENAYNKLNENGQQEVVKWHSKDSKNATAEDVAEGWILLKQYQDSGDYQSAVEVAKKMRDMGTKAGQAVQAYNILSRLTPEGMFYYAQGELSEAYNKIVQGKSKKWIENNRFKFELTPNETQNILDIMKDVSTMEDGYNKKVKLAEIQKIITDKIPPTAGQSIKSWMRISMLFNPKTQVRNVAGNATILPVNMFSDSVSAGIDKLISKKTGIRTIGNTNVKEYAKGFKKGLFESYNDFKKGVNTRNIEGNRFEVSEGRNFKNKGIGKALNRVDNLLSFMLDAGDRGFYEASFTNSINNQLVLNNTTQVTQDMIDIATNEALQRTWQDNNSYTQSVLKIRNILNKANIKGYGLGDVLIPFAKTPANLTKAIVDYSPAGLVKSLTMDARKFKNSLENGQYTAKAQHDFVQNLGKGTAGSFLYVLGYALAKAGIATGEADEDKDVKNFLKNSLGINSYSIKIGNKSFSYDWAQPIATPLAIMTNYVKYNEKNPDANVLDKAIQSINIGTEQLLQQSFMDSLNTVLNGKNGTTLENLLQVVLELPARAIPTFSKQIADMVDGTQRTSYEYKKPVQSAINSIKAKIPGLSKTLPASIDTLGNEIKKYGGENNFFNVFINPANTNKGELSKAGQEIYNLYQETGDTTIFPRTAPYYINSKGEKITMDSAQRSKFQTVSGSYVENTVEGLLRNKDYNKLSSEKKTKIINKIISDSYSKAKYDVLKIDSEEYEKLRKILKDIKTTSYYDYKFKTEEMKKDNEKINIIANGLYSDKEKMALYENYIDSGNSKIATIQNNLVKDLNIDTTEYLKYKANAGTTKAEKSEYMSNTMNNVSYMNKLILLGTEYVLTANEKSMVVNYIDSLNKTKKEKLELLSNIKGFTIDKDGTYKY